MTPPHLSIPRDLLVTDTEYAATQVYKQILTRYTVSKEPEFTPEQCAFLEAQGFSRGPICKNGTGVSYNLATSTNWYCALPDERGILMGCESRDTNAIITSEDELATFLRENP